MHGSGCASRLLHLGPADHRPIIDIPLIIPAFEAALYCTMNQEIDQSQEVYTFRFLLLFAGRLTCLR